MAKIHTLTYNGTKSSDLGVFVSGSGSFDAAEFDVDKYEIPGRNGDLILSNNRYKNIEITYPAFIPKAFMDKVQNVRNWLRSSRVYARLEDTYDMDHYRLGIPTGVQSFSPENRNDGANFEMTFDCKPQRFLKVGETPETVEADVQTESGEIVTFETVAESPMTSAEVSLSPQQNFANGFPSADNIVKIKGFDTVAVVVSETAPKHFTVKWDKVNSKCTRLNDAANITTTTTNFGHFGSVNANYNNPFDSIYPWSGRKLCNIDLDAYMALSSGDSITDCVSAWEGESGFSYNDPYGVWVYTPEFWGKTWGDGTNRYFDVTDQENPDYVHYPEKISGRWHGAESTLTINGSSKVCFLPLVGMNAADKAVSIYHAEAKNYGGTLCDIKSVDGSTLLMVVEYASLNSQVAIGNGASGLYRQSSDTFAAASTNSNVVHVVRSAAGTCIPGAIFDIGTSNGGIQIGRYYVVSTATNASDSTILDVTLNEAVTVTTANMWSVHGLSNVADEVIGSKSGYIGTNGYHNAYYRGEVLWGNKWQYTLGAYRQTGTGHIWICGDGVDPDNYDALNTSVHTDTGCELPASASTFLSDLWACDGLTIPPFGRSVGGDSTNPVGDHLYTPASTAGNTILLLGATAYSGTTAGAFYGDWSIGAGPSNWRISARPHLKNPS